MAILGLNKSNFGALLATINKVWLVTELLVWAVQAWQDKSLSHSVWRDCFGSRPPDPRPPPLPAPPMALPWNSSLVFWLWKSEVYLWCKKPSKKIVPSEIFIFFSINFQSWNQLKKKLTLLLSTLILSLHIQACDIYEGPSALGRS